MKDYLRDTFKYLFDREIDDIAAQVLIENWGEAEIRKVLKYLAINRAANELRPPTGRDNPYALIDKICQTDKFPIPKDKK